MKKFAKKIGLVSLSVVLSMSLMSVSAFADDAAGCEEAASPVFEAAALEISDEQQDVLSVAAEEAVAEIAEAPTVALSAAQGRILIPFTVTWDGDEDAADARPESIIVSLYKYLGTFNSATAALVDTKVVAAADGWTCTFDVSSEALFADGSFSAEQAYGFAAVTSDVEGYTLTAQTNPRVSFVAPGTATNWVRYTPCNELDISAVAAGQSIIVAKKGNRALVCSAQPLSPAERAAVQASAKSGINGIGNPTFAFFSGYGYAESFGLTFTQTKVAFDAHKDWSLLAAGTYCKSSVAANAASVTFTKDVVVEPVPEIVEIGEETIPTLDPVVEPEADPLPAPKNKVSPIRETDGNAGVNGELVEGEPEADDETETEPAVEEETEPVVETEEETEPAVEADEETETEPAADEETEPAVEAEEETETEPAADEETEPAVEAEEETETEPAADEETEPAVEAEEETEPAIEAGETDEEPAAETDEPLVPAATDNAGIVAGPQVPHTADSSNLVLWFALMTLALAGMAAVAFAKKNTEKASR